MDTLYIVVPCYNEQEVLGETAKRLAAKLEGLMAQNKISPQSRVLFVDDGSKDKTWELICRHHEENKLFYGLKLSRNKGHQNAVLAGLMKAKEYADMVVSIDADLQDDINAIDEMVDKYHQGCDVVYGVRSKRETDTFFKRTTAEGFYKVMKLLGVDVVFNHADYRLMSRRAVEALEDFREVNLFLRGIVPLIGFKKRCGNLRAQRALCGGKQISPKENAQFCHGGHHLFFREAHPHDYRPGFSHFHHQHFVFNLLFNRAFYRPYRGGLDHHCGFGLGHWRPSAFSPGGYRGICGQGIHGNQGAAKIFYRPVFRGRDIKIG